MERLLQNRPVFLLLVISKKGARVTFLGWLPVEVPPITLLGLGLILDATSPVLKSLKEKVEKMERAR